MTATRSAEFHLKATNGYAVSVYASHGDVWLTAKKGSKAQVSYFAHGVTSPGRIEAGFGALGSVAVRLHPSGSAREHRSEEGCRGRGESVQRGTFVGKIVFEGEQAYTTLDASRAQGKEARSFKQSCSEEDEGGSFHFPLHLTLLFAGSKSARTSLFAFKYVSKTQPALNDCLFNASIFERGQHLTILRTVSAKADVDSFTAAASGKTPDSATISPPAPFSGFATYEKAKGSSASWTGSLSASFPGLGAVPLTGSDWTAQLNPRSKVGSHGSGSFTGSFVGERSGAPRPRALGGIAIQ